ncbi:DNA/RNA non-specific endonuclease [Polynucleobacter sp. MWH-UH2A]|uniref:DNA/RNA non-specific endonuclease n=1 Tax=Polynucleobacter sp. MWH-UH2A TaxID=1855617 RepID=UPI001BFDFB55|nr:DNA/RNA non-specific endonuclease [Polynucleobacter sp. MWH-UH2A]QWD64415.1 DNA/RNA non-specific endonuclease [Polynucleobacter sp. MWH-UH2A]
MNPNRKSSVLFHFISLIGLVGYLLTPLSAFALFDNCKDLFPNQRIPTAPQVGRDLCFDSFAIYYSTQDKKPIYVVEKLNREQLMAPHPRRSNQFYEEARLPFSERALLSDYRGSGYDRGHNAPAGDMSNERAMAQSFSLANMMPQARQNNQGIWAKNVEEPTRHYAKRATGDIYVFTGSTGNQGSIGRGHVTIPSHLYKLVYDPSKNLAWAFWIENSNDALMTPPISYAELVSKTGIDFQLPIQTTQTVQSISTQSNKTQTANSIGGWYPVFFDVYSAEKVNAILTSIRSGKVASIQIQYDQNADLAHRIATLLQSQTQVTVELSQSSPPDTPGVTYERKRVTVIIRSKAN